MQLVQRPNVKIVDIDPWMGKLRFNHRFSNLYGRILIVPYIIRTELFAITNYVRNISVMFHGDTGRYDGGRRGAVRDILEYIPNSNYQSTFSFRGNESMLKKMHQTTLAYMKYSKTCMCPSGDTPTTRRLYESLASGCVPIRIDNIPVESLPFSKLINWANLTFKLHPRLMSLSQRHEKSNNSEIIMFRKQEAALINNYVQSSRLDDMRFAGIGQHTIS